MKEKADEEERQAGGEKEGEQCAGGSGGMEDEGKDSGLWNEQVDEETETFIKPKATKRKRVQKHK